MINKRKQAQKMTAGLVALSVFMSTPVFAAEISTDASKETANDTAKVTAKETAKDSSDDTAKDTKNTSKETSSSTGKSSSGSTVSKSTSGTAGVISFSDVSLDHWAIKHITKLAALGIIEGYEKNQYKPENSVSQQEVIVMALRMMGLEDEVLKNKSETVLPITVDTFFKPYVAYAFDKGLIEVNEEADSSSDSSKTTWGSRPATREWVAKLVIRAIDKGNLAQQKASVPSSFKDAKDFSSWAVGYVNAAVSLKIVDGVDDNNFQPKGLVTRAQMATFLSRADKEMTTHSDRVSIGYVMELKDSKLTIQDDKGQASTFKLNADTVIYNAKDDSRIASTVLKETYEVYVIDSQGTATYIELTNDEEKMGSVEGSLNQLFIPQMQLALNESTGVDLKQLAPNVTVTDKDGRGLSLSSIPLGSIIELKWNLLTPNPKISQIVVKQVPVSKTAQGTVVSIQKDQNTITFQEQSSGQNETYPLAALVPVKLPDGLASDISKLRVGDLVSYDIKANQLVSLTIQKQADVSDSVQGTLISISDDKKNMTVKLDNNNLAAYFVADNAIVEINGLSNAGFFDLEIGDELKLDLLNNKIVKVTVTSRTIKQMSFATISLYDDTTNLLAGTFEDGTPFAYKLTDSTALKIGDTTIPLTNFSSKFSKGDKIDLTVSKDKVITVELTTRLEGTLTQVNSTTNEVTVRTVSGQNLTLKTPAALTVATWSNPSGTINDLKIGDTVLVILNGSQDSVVQIAPTRTAVYKTLAANPDTRQVNAKDDSGALFTFHVDTNDKISNPGNATPKFEDIAQDEYIKVTYFGNTVDKVVMLNSVRGKVTGIDTADGTVTVQDYTNGVQVVPVGEKYVIKQNGKTSASLNDLKPGDRVEIIKDAGDKAIISVATPSKRTVQSYDNILNQLLFKPDGSNDKTTFNFFSKAYLHKGATSVAANDFAENDEVTIYVLDDKIVEIEK